MEKTALIIEDSSYMREILRKTLSKYDGVDILEAEDGKKGLSKFKEAEPDLILLDLNLPDIQGDELLEKMSEDEIDSDVLIVTGVPQEELLEKCLDLGAEDYIVKPFKLKELREEIEKFF